MHEFMSILLFIGIADKVDYWFGDGTAFDGMI
jgi:hypothetical protein